MTGGGSPPARSSAAPLSGARLDALYQELILDHYRRPRNKGALEPATARVELRNPLCGDEIEVAVAVDGDRVTDLRFTGRGCSISQAAASMMTQAVKGKPVSDAASLHRRYREMIMGSAEAAEDASLGELRALSGVSRFPARVRCALLAWEALGKAIARS